MVVNACIDQPKLTDWHYEDMFGSTQRETLPASYISKNTKVQNQNEPHVPATTYACTCYGISHISNEQNYIEKSGVETQGFTLREKALKLGAVISGGRTLQGALDLAKTENLIEGYARVATIDEMKRCIRENKFVYTGTNKCDWEQTNLNKSVFQKGSGYGHCFCIVGYDDAKDWFIAKNSFGDKYNDGGYFYIPYDNIGDLFSKYTVFDKKDVALITNYKKMTDQEYIRKAIEAGLLSNKDLDKPITREQMAIVLGRLLKLLGK